MVKKMSKKSRTKNIILSVSLAILSVMFIAYAIQSFYPSPKFEDFCDRTGIPIPVGTEIGCTNEEGLWIKGRDGLLGYCNVNYQCEKEYQIAKNSYEKNIFFINMVIGMVMFVVAFIFLEGILSIGFVAGGAIMLIYASVRHWGELTDIWRTMVIGVALSLLAWLGYKESKR